MPVKHLNIWRETYPEAMFVNVYGPTEITCNCTYYIVDREFALDETLPMGKAFPNERVFLLDDNDNLITPDMPDTTGEICVSGTAVTLGYYNNREKTDQAFVQNPLNDNTTKLFTVQVIWVITARRASFIFHHARIFRLSIWDTALSWVKLIWQSTRWKAACVPAVSLTKTTIRLSDSMKEHRIRRRLPMS